MKIACIGNMNNNFFALTRYLRDAGYDAELLLLNEFEHFLPEADTFSDEYKQYTKQLTWPNYPFYEINKKIIINDLKKYNFVIGCGLAPAYVNKAGLILDIYMPYGSDLYDIPFSFKPRSIFPLPKMILKGNSVIESINFSIKRLILYPLYLIKYIKTVKLNNYKYSRISVNQRKGIKKSKYVFKDLNQKFEDALNKLKYNPKKWISNSIPMVYTREFFYKIDNYNKKSIFYNKYKKIKNKHDLIIFHPTRHIWGSHFEEYSIKNNHFLFKGFSNFIKKNKSINSCIITYEYGSSVEASKKLIKKLKIEKNVYWFPKTDRKEIIIGLSFSDICAGQFNIGWLSSGVAYEALALEKPLITYRDDKMYINKYDELYPIINVKNADDIEKALNDYIKRPLYYKKLVKNGKKWFSKYVIQMPLNFIIQKIKNQQKKYSLSGKKYKKRKIFSENL